MAHVDVLGGIPVVTVIGTPRTMGHRLGERMRPRLQVLAQFLGEQLAAGLAIGDDRPDLDQVRGLLRPALARLADLEPSLAMEVESVAAGAELPIEDVLLIQGWTDLLSRLHRPAPPTRSTFIGLPAEQTANGDPLIGLAWEVDPALVPYLTVLQRMPAHGPANISLTLAGLQPIAGLSEERVAVASNELRVSDGTPGHLTANLVTAALSAPSFADALARIQAGPRWGGRALHLLDSEGVRASVELSGAEAAVLPDHLLNSPRVHTNHAIAENIARHVVGDAEIAMSKTRLGHIASRVVKTAKFAVDDVLDWFELRSDLPGATGQQRRARGENSVIANPDAVVVAVLDPRARALHLRKGTGTSLDRLVI